MWKKKEAQLKDISTLRGLDLAGLNDEIVLARRELFLLEVKHRANELKQPHLIRAQRKYIARIETVKTEVA